MKGEVMENFIYEREYPLPLEEEETDELEEEDMIHRTKLLSRYRRYLCTIPRMINPLFKTVYLRTLSKCDEIARSFFGKIRGVVDFNSFEASIELEVSFLEFRSGEFLEFLGELSAFSIDILFQPLTSGDLQVKIVMPYFSYLEQPESMRTFLDKNPDACD